MEDAIVLAKCLRDIRGTERVCAAFEHLRKDRVEKIVAGARRSGNQKVLSNALTRGLRDLALPLFLKMGARGAGRIYKVAWDDKVKNPRAGSLAILLRYSHLAPHLDAALRKEALIDL